MSLLACISYLNHGLRVRAIVRVVSYQITVTAHGGHLTVSHSGDVPDGTHVVSGHEDDSARSVSVSRHDHEGRQVANASAGHSRER